MKDTYRIDICEQLDNLKGLIGRIGDNPDPVDVARATIAAEFVTGRVREYCHMTLVKGGGNGMDSAAA